MIVVIRFTGISKQSFPGGIVNLKSDHNNCIIF